MSQALDALTGTNWADLRRKGWHAALMLASAYAANNPRYAWAVPVLTGVAGVSAPPSGIGRAGAVSMVVIAALVGVLMRAVV